MNHASSPVRVRLVIRFTLLAALLALTLAALPTHTSAKASTWVAWHIGVDFSQGQPQITWTSFVGEGTTIAGRIEHDITKQCTIHGKLRFDGDYAVFDGKTFIACDTPSFRDDIAKLAPALIQANTAACECQIGDVPFWAAADVMIEAPGSQPLFYKASDDALFALPTQTRMEPRTELRFNGLVASSPHWRPSERGNQIWLGNGGDYFLATTAQAGWAHFLRELRFGSGVAFLTKHVQPKELGHWVESAGIHVASDNLGTFGQYEMKTAPDTIYIGYDPSTGDYFNGMIRTLEVDPGCFG